MDLPWAGRGVQRRRRPPAGNARAVGVQALADGALAGPFTLREELVDDGDVAMAVVGAGEASAFEDGLPYGREVTRGYVVGVGIQRRLLQTVLSM